MDFASLSGDLKLFRKKKTWETTLGGIYGNKMSTRAWKKEKSYGKQAF